MDYAFYQNTINRSVHAHAANVKAGWWTNIETGESTLLTRNRAELLMLTASEVSEAVVGQGKPDDKLPAYDGFVVEMADAVIRVWDQMGAFIAVYGKPLTYELVIENRKSIRSVCSIPGYEDSGWGNSDPNCYLMVLCAFNLVSHAMECYRKGRFTEYFATLACFVEHAFKTVEVFSVIVESESKTPADTFYAIIAEKQAFNANRADHKIENRLKADGKKF